MGRRCVDPADGSEGCVRAPMGGVPRGWSMYSVERFYTAPLVHDVTCRADGDGTVLSFKTNTPFKMNNFHAGSYKVFDDGVNAANGEDWLTGDNFKFSPYWRHTYVEVDLSDYADDDGSFNGMLAVFDQWGDRTAKHVECIGKQSDNNRAPGEQSDDAAAKQSDGQVSDDTSAVGQKSDDAGEQQSDAP